MTVAVVGVLLGLGGVLFASAIPAVPARPRGFTLSVVTLFATALGVGALGGAPVVVVCWVALIAVYVLEPVGGFSGVGDWRATLALTLTLVSLLALVRLLD